MMISSQRLAAEADATGFRPEVLEKVIHLLDLLESIRRHPYLGGRLALKGGTALNLFIFDVPRLSVDIDLNYVGSGDLSVMLQERPEVDKGLQAVFSRSDYEVRREPDEHAGGKWLLRYDSATGQQGNLEVDLNYMYRVPLWPLVKRDSRAVGSYRAISIPVLDEHELAAGKLTALFARTSGRDVFDTHQLLTHANLDPRSLRLAFVVYGAMNRLDWRTICVSTLNLTPEGLAEQLLPMLRRGALGGDPMGAGWAAGVVRETMSALEVLLPFTSGETEFLDRLLDHGEIAAEVLTDDDELAERIRQQPGLHWKALNVRQHKLR